MGKECDGPILPRSQWTAEAGCWSPCVIPGMFVVGLMSLLVALVPLLIGDPEPCQGVDTQRYGDSAGIVLFVFGLVFYLVFSSLSLYSWISCAFTDPGCPPEFTLSASSSSLSASSLSASASPSSPASTSPSHSRKQQKKNKNNRAADNDDDDDDDDDEEKGRAQLGSPLTPTVDENSNSNSQNSQNSNDGSKRSKQCPRCHLLKGPRTHHCSTCRRCVVRYDHHCPWVNNCVGVRNHKFFFLFTFWGCINSLFVIMVLLLRYALVGWSFCLVDLGVLPAIILACFGGLFTGSMCVSHANLIARNMTTVEYTAAMEARYGARRPLARRGRPLPPPQPVDYYDLGCTANCAAIMGPSCLLCLCPVANQSASFDFPHPKYDEV